MTLFSFLWLSSISSYSSFRFPPRLTLSWHSLSKKPRAPILTGSEALSFLVLTVRNGAVPSPRTAASRGQRRSWPSASRGQKGKVDPSHAAVLCPCSSPLVQNLHTRAHTQNTHTLLTASWAPQLSLCNNIKHGFRMFVVTKQRRLEANQVHDAHIQ